MLQAVASLQTTSTLLQRLRRCASKPHQNRDRAGCMSDGAAVAFHRHPAAGINGVAPRLVDLVRRCTGLRSCTRAMSRELPLSTVRRWLKSGDRDEIVDDRVISPVFVWVWLDYEPGTMPRHVQLNLRALRRHAPRSLGFRIIYLNASSVGQWIELPAEFGRLRHKVAASDVARMGLLARYGGFYVDADVLVAAPLAPLAALLDEYEHVM